MSMEAQEKLRKQRGTPVYIYKADDFTLLYKFDSIQHMTNLIGIHRTVLHDHLNKGEIYLDTFYLSLDIIEESTKTNLLSLDELKSIVTEKRDIYIVKHPAARSILAERRSSKKSRILFIKSFS